MSLDFSKDYRPVFCRILERHPITHEPSRLEVLPIQQEIHIDSPSLDLSLIYVPLEQYRLTLLPSPEVKE